MCFKYQRTRAIADDNQKLDFVCLYNLYYKILSYTDCAELADNMK